MNPKPSSRTFRILSLAVGILLLAWLPLEDTGLHWIFFYAAVLGAFAAVRILIIRPAQKRTGDAFVYCLAGGVAGLLVTPAALLLMALKTGIHGHSTPDFTPGQLRTVLALAPEWILAGLLAGLGTMLAVIARR